jgi:deoxyribose-phosphate aldolase
MTRAPGDASPADFSAASIARRLDHSLLRPDLARATLEGGCREALHFGVASVCVLPYFVKEAARLLDSSGVVTSTTVGFPHGGESTIAKLAEARAALDSGAQELDAVVNISLTLSGEYAAVQKEIEQLLRVTHDAGGRLKVIFENCYLEDRHKIELCRLCSAAGVDWVKTSTGFGSGGATFADVRLMRDHVSSSVEVKASGGIGDLDSVIEYLKLGVTRIGTSRTRAILEVAEERFSETGGPSQPPGRGAFLR